MLNRIKSVIKDILLLAIAALVIGGWISVVSDLTADATGLRDYEIIGSYIAPYDIIQNTN